MIIVRHDCIGKAELKLIKRPTNTCAWVDNWHLYATSSADAPSTIPVVRFFGTDGERAREFYDQAVKYAQAIPEFTLNI